MLASFRSAGSVRALSGIRPLRAGAAALLTVLALCSCETQQERIAHHEDNLAAAGFLVRPANTPERIAMLSQLPPNRFVMRVHGDTVHYVYADPMVCGCLYIGTQQAYNQYKRDRLQQHMVDEQAMAAEMYSNAAWNWSAWGPWGPGYGFAFGPTMGW